MLFSSSYFSVCCDELYLHRKQEIPIYELFVQHTLIYIFNIFIIYVLVYFKKCV